MTLRSYPSCRHFFPDPAALDAEDPLFKIYCEEVLAKEYRAALEALLPYAQLLEQHLAKQLERAKEATAGSVHPATIAGPLPDSLCDVIADSDRGNVGDTPLHAVDGTQPNTARLAAGGKHRGPRSIDISDSKKGITPPEVVLCSGSSEATDEREVVEQRASCGTGGELSLTGGSPARSDVLPFGVNLHSGCEVTDCGEKQLLFMPTTVTQVMLTAPHPPELIENAEKIGLANATRGTRVAAVKITKLQQENDLKLIVPAKPSFGATPGASSPSATTPADTTPRTSRPRAPSVQSLMSKSGGSHQNASEALASGTAGLCMAVGVADVLFLEATEHASVEMHCEAMCNDIVNAAAEMYVSRFFDSMANAYTALSAWDELHTTLVHSFVPERPSAPDKLETKVAESLAIRRERPREGKDRQREGRKSFQGVVDVANDFLVEANECSTYLGMLPVWARCPSLLSSNSILSFHQNTVDLARTLNAQFDLSIDGRAQRPCSRAATSTFAQFLSVLDGSANEAPVSGSSICNSRIVPPKVAEARLLYSSLMITDEGDSECPGTPPPMIPIDDYARYVIPPIRTVEDDQTNNEQGRPSTERQSHVKKKNSNSVSADPRGGATGKAGGTHATNGARRGHTTNSVVTSESRQLSRSRVRSFRSVTEKSSKAQLPPPVCSGSLLSSFQDDARNQADCDEDDWRRAMRQISQCIAGSGVYNVNTSQQNHTAETLLYVEDGDVSAVTVGMKAGKRVIKEAEVTSGRSAKSVSRPRTGELSSPLENVFVGGRNEKLRVGITEDGRVSFRISMEEEDESAAVEQRETQTQSQSSKTEMSSRRRRSLMFLTRKQKRDLEERQRRKREAAEKLAYESLFYTLPKPPTPDSIFDESDRQSPTVEEGGQKKVVLQVVPEPGVVVEKWLNPQQENAKGKTSSGSKGQWRNEASPVSVGKTRSNVLADGGEWIAPDGKYHWSSFGGTSGEKGGECRTATATTPGAGRAGDTAREVTGLPSSGQQRVAVGGVESGDGGKKTQSYLQRQQKGPGQHAVARSFKWEPPTVIFSNQNEKRPEDEQTTSEKDTFLLLGFKKGTENSAPAGKGSSRRPVLPRLPSIDELKDISPRRRLNRRNTSKSLGSQEEYPQYESQELHCSYRVSMPRHREGVRGAKVSKKAPVSAAGRPRLRSKSRRGKDGDDVQKSAALNLNNPLIPPELDEDIDDELAFNSEDEELYGHFFSKKVNSGATVPSTAVSKRKSKNKREQSNDEESDTEGEDNQLLVQQLRALGEIDGPEDLQFHELGDDGDDYVDIADMLDAAQMDDGNNQGKVGEKRKKKKKVDADGITKKRRLSRVTEEDESIYGPASGVTESKFGSAMREMLTAAPQGPAQSRLQRSMTNKNNLISVDMDDSTKDRVMREKVREAVAKDLEKYKVFLRSYHESKHIQLPMRMPKSNPIPANLGAIAAAAEAQLAAADPAGSAVPAQGMTGNATRASALRLAGKVNALLTRAGIAKPQLESEEPDDGVVPFDSNDDDEGASGVSGRRGVRDGGVPTTSYMAKLKAMLSYENARRRRVNRIKSKTYRRILRHERERERERREKAFELLHPEKARARLAERLMKARVEERVTQKHKNTSKWVRHAKRFAQFDDNTKDAINEQHMLHERLMRKMEEDADADAFLNAAGGGEDGSEISSEEERVVDRIIAEATGDPSHQSRSSGTGDHKKKLTALLWRGVDDSGEGGEEGQAAMTVNMTSTEKARADLQGMKFMQQARDREEKLYEEMLDQMQEDVRRKARGEVVRSDDEPSDLDEDAENLEACETRRGREVSRTAVKHNAALGRLAFKKGDGKDGGPKPVEVVESIRLKRRQGIDAQEVGLKENLQREGNELSGDEKETWSVKHSESDGEATLEDPGAAVATAKEVKRSKPKDEFAGSRKAKAEPPTSLSLDAVTPLPKGKKSVSTRMTILPGGSKRPRDELHSSSEDKIEHEEAAAGSKKNQKKVVKRRQSQGKEGGKQENEREEHLQRDDEKALLKQQEYLIARAFAQDDVDADFMAEKMAQVTSVMKPIDKNASLPGWGEWGGTDPRLNTKHQAKLQAVELQREIEKTTLMKSRADAALDHVIINHDGVELVPDRMLLHMVPRPFSNPTEFARSMRHPYGPEWNTAISFKEANQPRVEVRQGHVVPPLDLSLRGKKAAKTKRRKSSVSVRP